MNQIFLSRRNLQTLLNKLDRQKRGGKTACTIVKSGTAHQKYPQTMDECLVTAIEDEEYYAKRKPGRVFPKDDPK